MEEYASTFQGFNDAQWSCGNSFGILNVKTDTPVSALAADTLTSMTGGRFWRACSPELLVVSSRSHKLPFETTTKMIDYPQKRSPSVETCCGIRESTQRMERGQRAGDGTFTMGVIKNSFRGGFQEGNDMDGIVKARAPRMKEAFASGKYVLLGAIDIGAPISLSIMEYSNCSGAITCIPTGGSSGVFPGALCGAAKSLNKTEEDVVHALLIAGLIGTFMEPAK